MMCVCSEGSALFHIISVCDIAGHLTAFEITFFSFEYSEKHTRVSVVAKDCLIAKLMLSRVGFALLTFHLI